MGGKAKVKLLPCFLGMDINWGVDVLTPSYENAHYERFSFSSAQRAVCEMPSRGGMLILIAGAETFCVDALSSIPSLAVIQQCVVLFRFLKSLVTRIVQNNACHVYALGL